MNEQLISEIGIISVACILVPILFMWANYPYKGIATAKQTENFEGFFALMMGNAFGALISIILILI